MAAAGRGEGGGGGDIALARNWIGKLTRLPIGMPVPIWGTRGVW